LFSGYSILLGSEGELDEGCCWKLTIGDEGEVEQLDTAKQLDILEAKRVSVIITVTVFTWTHKKVKGDDQHVGDGKLGLFGGRINVNGGDSVVKYLNGNGLDSPRGRVEFGE
jgi:hypothetical protein